MRTGIDCFAGIGGFSLAMRNCGINPKVQIEIDEYCQEILKKNFPKAKRFGDICTVSDADLRRFHPWIVTGGFPCQDISTAGRGAGLVEGDRSGLWREMWRVIKNTRPDWVLIENVPAIRTRGIDTVLSGLEALNYTGWPFVVGACHAGASHQRKRMFYVAYSNRLFGRAISLEIGRTLVEAIALGAEFESSGSMVNAESDRGGSWGLRIGGTAAPTVASESSTVADADSNTVRKQSRRRGRKDGREAPEPTEQDREWDQDACPSQRTMDDTTGGVRGASRNNRRESSDGSGDPQARGHSGNVLVDTIYPRYARRMCERVAKSPIRFPAYPGECQYGWEQPRAIPIKSGLGGAIDGVSRKLDRFATALYRNRIKALGNAIIPQNAEAIIRAVITVEELLREQKKKR